MAEKVTINVNGVDADICAAAATPLLHILRNDLELNGPKYGCGLAECGACAVLADGKPVRSCVVPLAAVGKAKIVTLEGLGTPEAPHPVQQAFVDHAAAQCGYCLNGMIIAIAGLLNQKVEPDESDLKEALRHHLCRCGTHLEILEAARSAIAERRSEVGA